LERRFARNQAHRLCLAASEKRGFHSLGKPLTSRICSRSLRASCTRRFHQTYAQPPGLRESFMLRFEQCSHASSLRLVRASRWHCFHAADKALGQRVLRNTSHDPPYLSSHD
jgi:hypothetical protein